MNRYSVRPSLTNDSRASLSVFPDLLAHLLYHRGHTTNEGADKFINPDYDRDIHNPFLLKNSTRAAERIIKAIREDQKVVIYSDYDTDGIPGGVTLHDFFKKIGFKNFINYIPHRHDEGFGLNVTAIEQFIKDEVRLIITIDCGIADIVPVTKATEAGIDVIITDHHLPGEIIPPAYAIINPKQSDCEYPEKMLCGSGVIFKLIQAIIQHGNFTDLKEGWEKWLLDMVGIATLSDMVPLVGENRVFARYGLLVLRKTPRLGLVRLLSKLKIQQKYLTEDDIGFMISPRINAASRMGVPMDAFNLLVASDEASADHCVSHLNAINDERKGTVAALIKQVKHTLNERHGKNIPKVIVLGNPDWRPSLLGLAANTLAEEYSRPVFLWGRDGDGLLKGSCRSDGVTNLIALMNAAVPGAFLQFGGHAQSGGFSLGFDEIHTLSDRLNTAYELSVQTSAESVEYIDSELFLDEVTWKTYSLIDSLAPFGVGNPKPLFIFRNITPREVKAFGKEKNHTELVFENSKGKVPAIGFFMKPESLVTEKGEVVEVGKSIDLVAHIEKSTFRNRPELRLRIVDIL